MTYKCIWTASVLNQWHGSLPMLSRTFHGNPYCYRMVWPGFEFSHDFRTFFNSRLAVFIFNRTQMGFPANDKLCVGRSGMNLKWNASIVSRDWQWHELLSLLSLSVLFLLTKCITITY